MVSYRSDAVCKRRDTQQTEPICAVVGEAHAPQLQERIWYKHDQIRGTDGIRKVAVPIPYALPCSPRYYYWEGGMAGTRRGKGEGQNHRQYFAFQTPQNASTERRPALSVPSVSETTVRTVYSLLHLLAVTLFCLPFHSRSSDCTAVTTHRLPPIIPRTLCQFLACGGIFGFEETESNHRKIVIDSPELLSSSEGTHRPLLYYK